MELDLTKLDLNELKELQNKISEEVIKKDNSPKMIHKKEFSNSPCTTQEAVKDIYEIMKLNYLTIGTEISESVKMDWQSFVRFFGILPGGRYHGADSTVHAVNYLWTLYEEIKFSNELKAMEEAMEFLRKSMNPAQLMVVNNQYR